MRTSILSATIAALLMAGCDDPPTGPKVAPAPPPPATAVGVATYFQNSWQGMSPDQYRALLAGNFAFDFAVGDTAGIYYSATPWDRADEESCAVHIFRSGTPSQPPATSITVSFVSAPTDSADPRPGKNPKWHRLITVNVLARIFFAESGYEITGPCRFFVVRGDSAQIPADQRAVGVRPDPNRWWLECWADETFHPYSAAVPSGSPTRSAPATGPPSARVQANNSTSWGAVKALYR